MKNQSGNVLIYVMIAVILFAGLTMILAKRDSGGPSGRLSDDQAGLRAQELISYATGARATVEQMRAMLNVLPTEISFVKQGQAGYDTGSNSGKIFHPGGGGLSDFTASPELFATGTGRGWVAQQGTNVGWSETTGSDIIFSFVDTTQQICQAINEKLYKEKSIPTMTLSSSAAFVNGGADDADFTATTCSSCNGRISMCVQDSGGAYAFYTVLLSR